MYDYNNGRFLSVDPFIQDPSSTQSLNPYTYIFNNPLSGIDPSGYTAKQEPRTQGFTLKSGLVFTGASISTGSRNGNNNNVIAVPLSNGSVSLGSEGADSKGSRSQAPANIGSRGQFEHQACQLGCHGSNVTPEELFARSQGPNGDSELSDFVLGVTPFAGEYSSFHELFTGETPFGNEGNRWMALLGVATLGISQGFRAADRLSDLADVTRADPMEIMYTQSTVSKNFSDGRSINDTVAELIDDPSLVDRIPAIRVVQDGNVKRTLDNRRLTCFLAAGCKNIPVKQLDINDMEVFKEFLKKNNPVNDGVNTVIINKSKDRKKAEALLRAHDKIK